MGYPRYSEMKEVDLEWLKEIPKHCEIAKLKYIVREKITDGPHKTPTFLDDGYPFLSVDAIQNGEVILDNCRYISKEEYIEFREKCNPEKDDILFGKAASVGKIALIDTDVEFSVWSPLALIKPDFNEVIPEFLEYALKSDYLQQEIDIRSTRNTQQNISMDDIKNLSIILFPYEEQEAIADFLDQKTDRIDKLIDKKEKLIELLEEKRQAMISETVTKGLDSDVEMKDSGIEWLGEIPEHWEIVKLKYLTKNEKDAIKTGPFGSNLTSEDMKNSYIKVYNQKNVLKKDLNIGDNYISKEKYNELKSFTVYSEDILVTTRGTIGEALMVSEKAEKGVLHPCLMRIQVNKKKIIPKYMEIIIDKSTFFKHQLILASNSTTIEVIYSSNLKNSFIPLPPLEEQKKILNSLIKIHNKFDQLIDKIETQISNLKEHRKTLITKAVIGKIDVRELAE